MFGFTKDINSDNIAFFLSRMIMTYAMKITSSDNGYHHILLIVCGISLPSIEMISLFGSGSSTGIKTTLSFANESFAMESFFAVRLSATTGFEAKESVLTSDLDNSALATLTVASVCLAVSSLFADATGAFASAV